MAKLYPPVIEGTIPAFNGTDLTVPFSMNRSVSQSQIRGFALKIKTIQSNTWLATLTDGRNNTDWSAAVFHLSSDEWEPTPGQYYKLQLAYIDNYNEIGYFSTVGVVKYTDISSENITLQYQNYTMSNVATTYPFTHEYAAVYRYSTDPVEKIYQYRFNLYNNNDELLYTSDWQLHDATQDDSLYTSIDVYNFVDDLNSDEVYYLQYQAITVNGLRLNSSKYKIVMAEEMVSQYPMSLIAENNYDNGYVRLIPHGQGYDAQRPDSELYISGQFRIYRCDLRNPKRWEPIFTFTLQQEQPSTFDKALDFTVEHGVTYQYKICQFNEAGIIAVSAYSNEVYVDFEDMFLFDGERQLKVRFNPKVSSFKNDILESKLDTIGSKYPFFFRNGTVHYKEFPISGLVSYWSDNEELFIPLKDINIDTENAVRNYTPTYPAYEVQDVREQVRHWIVEVDPVTHKDKSHWSSWFDNGSIWTMSDYPHQNVEYIEDGQLVSREYRTYARNQWSATTEAWIREHNVPVANYRVHSQIDTENIDTFKPDWQSQNWGAGTGYAFDKHYKTTNLLNYNIAAERQFKLSALEWLTNGKPKLFRSPAEGNYIVRLLNTSLTPTDSLGRMLHTFSSTAYEIDDLNYDTLNQYNFINTGNMSEEKQTLRFRTLDLVEIYEQVLKDQGRYSLNGTGDNQYIELLINPRNGTAITAQGLAIEDCEYGDIFEIDGQKIMIGATQSYYLQNLHPINSIKLYPAKLAAIGRKTSPFSEIDNRPLLTYSYFDGFTGISEFDKIVNLEYKTIPARQFTRINTADINKSRANIISEIEDIKTHITKIYEVAFELRPIETIYSDYTWTAIQRAASFNSDELIQQHFSFDAVWNERNGAQTLDLIQHMPFYIYEIKPALRFSTSTQPGGLMTNEQWIYEKVIANDSIQNYNKYYIITVDDLTHAISYEEISSDMVAQVHNAIIGPNVETTTFVINDKTWTAANLFATIYKQTLVDVMTYIVDESHGRYIYLNGEFYDSTEHLHHNAEEMAELTDLYYTSYEQMDTYESPIYLVYEENKFVFLDGNQLDTRVYINTGESPMLSTDTKAILDETGQYIDLAEAIQPIVYYDLDQITDIYAGSAVLTTISYQTLITTYSFESEPDIAVLKDFYLKRQAGLETARKNFASASNDADPDYQIASFFDPAIQATTYKTLGAWVVDSYANYIDALTKYMTAWREENNIDEY